jgi:hypothetical protein
LKHVGRLIPPDLLPKAEALRNEIAPSVASPEQYDRVNDINEAILWSLVQNSDLYDESLVWPNRTAELEWLIRRAADSAEESFLIRRNILLLYCLFSDVMPAYSGNSLNVSRFVSSWMNELTGIKLSFEALSTPAVEEISETTFVGCTEEFFLLLPTGVSTEPRRRDQRGFVFPGQADEYFRPIVDHDDRLLREESGLQLLSAFFGSTDRDGNVIEGFRGSYGAGIGGFSSGLHYLLPIVVQSAVMQANDVFIIENPEVHLHPNLQIRVMDMLLDQALAGKYVLIETHSDLVIRRVIRAILSEESGQNLFSINFVGVRVDEVEEDGGSRRFKHSVVKPISLNDRGQITNWPDGFLDEDIGESQRLMDVMYGGLSASQNEDLEGVEDGDEE